MASLGANQNKSSFRGAYNMPTLSKSTKVFFNVQGTQHSLNTMPTMVYDQAFSTVKWQQRYTYIMPRKYVSR
jgi:hypothetical protein